jgi:hypothetical protein
VEWYGKGNAEVLVDRMARLLHGAVGCVNGHSRAWDLMGLLRVCQRLWQIPPAAGYPEHGELSHDAMRV